MTRWPFVSSLSRFCYYSSFTRKPAEPLLERLGREVERVKGIEPSYAAWEAAVLPLNYTRNKTGLNLIDPGRFASVDFLKIATPDCLLPSLAGEHDLVAFSVGAEGEVGRFAGLVGHRFVAEDAAGGDEFGGSGDDIGDLEREAGPCGFVLAAAVDAEG